MKIWAQLTPSSVIWSGIGHSAQKLVENRHHYMSLSKMSLSAIWVCHKLVSLGTARHHRLPRNLDQTLMESRWCKLWTNTTVSWCLFSKIRPWIRQTMATHRKRKNNSVGDLIWRSFRTSRPKFSSHDVLSKPVAVLDRCRETGQVVTTGEALSAIARYSGCSIAAECLIYSQNFSGRFYS